MDFDKVREAARGGARIDGVLSRNGARFLANEQGMTVMLGRGENEEARERAGKGSSSSRSARLSA